MKFRICFLNYFYYNVASLKLPFSVLNKPIYASRCLIYRCFVALKCIFVTPPRFVEHKKFFVFFQVPSAPFDFCLIFRAWKDAHFHPCPTIYLYFASVCRQLRTTSFAVDGAHAYNLNKERDTRGKKKWARLIFHATNRMLRLRSLESQYNHQTLKVRIRIYPL